MKKNTLLQPITLGAFFFIGLLSLGFFIYKGLKTFSDKDRVVTVKGLAEMQITAIAATMTLEFMRSGDEIQDLINQSAAKKDAIVNYLTALGYQAQSVDIEQLDITDREKNYEMQWHEGKQIKTKIDRYTTLQRMTVAISNVKKAEEIAAEIKLALISKNLSTTITTKYSFPELNSIKPKLIAESTKNARIAGEQFANDSNATLGKIKTASQGQITLAGTYLYGEDALQEAEQPEEPYIQKARVVSTIVFFLE